VRQFARSTEQLLHALASMAAVAMQNASHTQELKEANYDTIFRLAVAAEVADPDTANHLRRMSHYSQIIARRFGASKEEQELVFHAATAHDVGKVGIPATILKKPGPLDPQEWEIMRTHPTLGGKILGNSRWPIGQACEEIALTHHEKWDGTGYPRGLSGQSIPLRGRIVALADVFDALASKRCYKAAFPMNDVVAMITREVGKQFDPAVVEAFLKGLDAILVMRDRYKDSET